MKYLTTQEFAKRHKISPRMAAYYCQKNQILGVIKKGKTWLIPETAEKPRNNRENKSSTDSDNFLYQASNNKEINELTELEKTYHINEINTFIKVTRETIRHYEKQGLFIPHRDDENNYRIFDGFDIFRLMVIDFYKKRGFSTSEIKKVLAISTPTDLVSILDKKQAEINKTILEYQQSLTKLQQTKAFIEKLQHNLDVFSIQDFPSFKIKSTFSSFADFHAYQEKVFSIKDFSCDDVISNLVRIFHFNDEAITSSQMCIVEERGETFTKKKCIHIIASADTDDANLPHKMYTKGIKFAQQHQLKLKGTVYVFMRLFLLTEDIEQNYYEIYIPIH